MGAAACAAPSAVPERVTLRTVRVDRRYLRGRLHAKVEYPEVIGLRDAALQARINRTVRSAYPPPHGLEAWLKPYLKEKFEPGEVQDLDGDYRVSLNRGHLLSIYFSGGDDLHKNGHIVGAHPNFCEAAVTLDTRTGRPFKLSDLFSGANWRDRLDHIIAHHVGFGDGKQGLTEEEILGMAQAHEYWYYLTPSTMDVYDIATSYAAHALSASIPYRELKPIINPKGPLPALSASRP